MHEIQPVSHLNMQNSGKESGNANTDLCRTYSPRGRGVTKPQHGQYLEPQFYPNARSHAISKHENQTSDGNCSVRKRIGANGAENDRPC